MTSRLKRKLGNLGVDTASAKANESFCLIGTPLPPLEKSRDTGEFVPLWQQDVRDEKGRRRLHGAFTGGFSAGYFNTVGSKEGWTPATFTSSRADRAKKKAARPEDFMDEEDLAELRDNLKLVDTTEEMDLDFWEQGRKSDAGAVGKDSITSALESALLPAPRDSVGAQILKKMGWRVGHGIGPKITYEERKRQLALSHLLPSALNDLEDTEDHEEAKRHLYPPIDTKVPFYGRKDNSYGLGYEPGMGLVDMVSAESGDKAGQGPNISAGFGLGALNDADEDDIDVYDRGSDRGNRRLAFDEEEEDRTTMGFRNKRPPKDRPSSHLSRLMPGESTTFKNGMTCLPGFMVYEKPLVDEIWFPPPKVPEGWTPDPRRVWELDKENVKTTSQDEIKTEPPKDAQGRRRTLLTHDQRGNLLGETPLPAAPRSVFDYLSTKDRDRLKNLATGNAQPGSPTPAKPGHAPPSPEPEATTPHLDPQVAKMALQGFQPFTADPVKQARYTAFLQAQAAGSDDLPFGRAPGQAADSFIRELQDYARSAQIFKPVSGAMAGRFTRAAVLDTGAKALEGLHRPMEAGSYLSTPTREIEEEAEKKEESPKENAARLGMYGPLTREVKPWVPAKLLCKRFGVKEPVVGVPTEVAPSMTTADASNLQSGSLLSITDGSQAGPAESTQIGEDPGPSSSTGKGWRARDIANIGLGEDETQGRDILTYQRPSLDIFKAIFASDDEDEGEGENGDEDANGGVIDEIKVEGQQLNGDLQENARLAMKDVGSEGPRGLAKLTASTSTSTTRPLKAHVDYNDAAGKVDMTSFKPTFVPRSERQKDKEKKKDKSKKKKTKTTLVSFEVDEEGEGMPVSRSREKERDGEKKRKRKKAEADNYDDESMWVEKRPPEAVQDLANLPSISASNNGIDDEELLVTAEMETDVGPSRGRKRAIDFM
ncbi:hypothetical protein M0805_001395 [Coniferiporia weirii]|nr:hypothetical protein M0805_001395 [Coniferiporia weirii]